MAYHCSCDTTLVNICLPLYVFLSVRVHFIKCGVTWYERVCALDMYTMVEISVSLPTNNMAIFSPLVYSELNSTGHFEQMSQTVDEEEHSIEMHLPYVAKVMESRRGQFTVVPILVGALNEEKEIFYGRLLSKYLADQDNLFVISSDFCHWGEK